MNHFRKIFFFAVIAATAGCTTKVGVFEKNLAFKKHEWPAKQPATVDFAISDTTALYNIYIVLRHTDAYSYNNIWLKVSRKGPDTTYVQQMELRLATNDKGWLGTGIDDIWEVRTKITQAPARFPKSGNYQFVLEHIMRQDPLMHIMNAGIRIEKAP